MKQRSSLLPRTFFANGTVETISNISIHLEVQNIFQLFRKIFFPSIKQPSPKPIQIHLHQSRHSIQEIADAQASLPDYLRRQQLELAAAKARKKKGEKREEDPEEEEESEEENQKTKGKKKPKRKAQKKRKVAESESEEDPPRKVPAKKTKKAAEEEPKKEQKKKKKEEEEPKNVPEKKKKVQEPEEEEEEPKKVEKKKKKVQEPEEEEEEPEKVEKKKKKKVPEEREEVMKKPSRRSSASGSKKSEAGEIVEKSTFARRYKPKGKNAEKWVVLKDVYNEHIRKYVEYQTQVEESQPTPKTK